MDITVVVAEEALTGPQEQVLVDVFGVTLLTSTAVHLVIPAGTVGANGSAMSKELRLKRGRGGGQRPTMTQRSPVRHFKTSPEIIHLTFMMFIRFPLFENINALSGE